MHLLLFDTAGIQPYIFRSNRLRENVGASHLVAQATGRWVLAAARTVSSDPITPDQDGRRSLESDPAAEVELVYTAGGNALVLARNADVAEALTKALSEHVLREAPGLRLLAAGRPVELEREPLPEVLKTLFGDLDNQKRRDPGHEPLLGLAVTRPCRATGLPAVAEAPAWGSEAPAFVSAEVLAKLHAVRSANRALREAFPLPAIDGVDLRFPTELDDLGRTSGDTSLVAVVHADGDGMGARFRALGRAFDAPEQNRAYITAFRDLSARVDAVGQRALQTTLDDLAGHVQVHEAKGQSVATIEHRNRAGDLVQQISLPRAPDGDAYYLPVRPIISGGDDLTLVCDGRIGLSLTARYLEAFEAEARAAELQGVTASAGVALVKSHFPFARAYDLSEQLAGSAKQLRREIGDGDATGCLDWHLARGALYDSADAMREREYRTPDGLLTLRPVVLRPVDDVPLARTWPVVAAGTAGFQSPAWLGRRNKAKRILDALRDGPDAVQKTVDAIAQAAPARRSGEDVRLPALPGLDSSTDGWTRVGEERRALYFDALEIADLHLPFDPPSLAHDDASA